MVRTRRRDKKALIVGLEGCFCAVPITHVIETMRPLPVEPISGVPSFVQGISIIRGIPTPVVDLGAILGTPGERPERFVTLRVGDRQVALSVNAVVGVRDPRHNHDHRGAATAFAKSFERRSLKRLARSTSKC